MPLKSCGRRKQIMLVPTFAHQILHYEYCGHRFGGAMLKCIWLPSAMKQAESNNTSQHYDYYYCYYKTINTVERAQRASAIAINCGLTEHIYM